MVKGTIQTAPIDPSAFLDANNLEIGATVVFQGVVRKTESSRDLLHLFYECEERMAGEELNRILGEAEKKFSVIDAVAVHRIGIVKPGEISLYVAVYSSHRSEGFDACRYIVEAVKQRLPIWKKDHFADGSESWH